MSNKKIAKYLEILKEQNKINSDKLSEVYKAGIDLINFCDSFETVTDKIIIPILSKEINCSEDDLSWYLYENVEKKYFNNEGEVVAEFKTARDFVEYYDRREK